MSRVAIVSGGTGSIGRAVCACLLAVGLEVIAADGDADGLAEGARFMSVDVRSDGDIAALADAARQMGELVAIVAAHGVLSATDLFDLDTATANLIADVNLTGTMRLCAMLGGMLGNGGSMVTLSSVTAQMGRTSNAIAYQASKAGIEAITRSYAVAMAPRGVRVNCVAPGYLSEPMRGAGAQMRARQGGNAALQGFTPGGRLVTPHEVAEAIAFLCSPAASGISGIVLPVDGGQRAY